MANDLTFKILNTVHQFTVRVTGGRIGGNLLNMPVVELVTTGRKSGQRRSVMLTSPLQEDSTFVVVASRGGDDVNPAWYHNVVANPDVEVAIAGKPAVSMTARVATETERARMWPLITSAHENYAGYQSKTDREIPLVLLEPLDS